MENKMHITDYMKELNKRSPGFISTTFERGDKPWDKLTIGFEVKHPLVPKIELDVPASGIIDATEFDNKIRSLLEECDLPEELQKRLNIYKEKAS